MSAKTLAMAAALGLSAAVAAGCASRTCEVACYTPPATLYRSPAYYSPVPVPVPAAPDAAVAVLYRATDQGPGERLGTVAFADTPQGLEVRTDLSGLPPGEHGFHVHEKADCSPMMQDGKMNHALAAGGHFDPDKTGKHLGPGGGGHKGDLPKLVAGADGTVKAAMLVPGVKTAEFRNRSVMVHAGGDNYADTPAALGGGGARIACGIIE